jgi:hypothetical protein
MVYDGGGDAEWARIAGRQNTYWKPKEFEAALWNRANYGRFVFVDEAPILYNMTRRREEFERITFLGSAGRQYGFNCYFIAQGPTMLDKMVRLNCIRAIVFRQASEDDAKMIARKYGGGKELIRKIMDLKPLHYFELRSGVHVPKVLKAA